jgi:hypothetical protein
LRSQKLQKNHAPSNIVNVDESNWRLVMASEQVVGKRGAEVVHNYQDGDPKANFSFFGSICADGTKLPLILIARGKTARSHRQFGHQVPDPHQIWHSPKGWSTEGLMHDYLDWLRERLPDGPVCLIHDQNGTHVTDAVTTKASHPGISLLWIPKVQPELPTRRTDAFLERSNRREEQSGGDSIPNTTTRATEKWRRPC